MKSTDTYLQNKYKLEKVLGQGGMGKVHLAFDTEKKRKVAVKQILVPEYVKNKDMFFKRFSREYLFLSSINHPNIIKAFDFFKEQETSFLVFEFVEGISLKEFIPQKALQLALSEKLAIAIQITRAIEVLNTAGIIHRDIKPGNIMVDEKSHLVKLLDLGVAKSTDKNLERLTGTGAQVGTPAYMSPEQVNGDIAENTDIFALGTVFYQLFLGLEHSPFRETNTLRTMLNICEKKVPSLITQINKQARNTSENIYLQLSELIDKTLEKETNKRVQKVTTVAKKLEMLHQNLQTREQVSLWKATSPLQLEDLQKLKELVEKHSKESSRKRDKQQQKRKTIKPNKVKYIIGISIFVSIIFFVFFDKKTNVEKDIKNTKIPPSKNAEFYKSQGTKYFAQKRYKEAEKNYNKAIALDPKNAMIYYDRGLLYRELKKYKEAERDYSKAISLDSQNAFFYHNRGLIHYLQNRQKEAEKDYDRAINLNPKYSEVYNNKGLLYYYQKKYKEAEENYSKAIIFNPKNALAYSNRGHLYANQKRYKEAERDLSKAIALDPERVHIYFKRADVHYYQKKYKEAEKDYNKAITLAPHDTEAYRNRGILHYAQQKYRKAIKDWQKAIFFGGDREEILPWIVKAKKQLEK